MEECIDLTCERGSVELNAKRTKMFNQVKRIIELPDTRFKTLINVLKQSMGEEAGEVLQQLYQEKDLH